MSDEPRFRNRLPEIIALIFAVLFIVAAAPTAWARFWEQWDHKFDLFILYWTIMQWLWMGMQWLFHLIMR